MCDRSRGEAATTDGTDTTDAAGPGSGRRRRRGRVSHVTVVAYLALFFAMSGTAVAATGGTFILGQSNSASSVTRLTNSEGVALSLRSPAGTAPLAVNRPVVVTNLNADMVDGRHAADLATRAQLKKAVARIAELENLLAGASRMQVNGQPTLQLSGINLQVVNGTGTTGGDPNGLGNLLIGYDTPRGSEPHKSGSHYLIIGNEHNYTSYGGIVSGARNTASGPYASVTGGYANTATGPFAAVTGGYLGTASGQYSSVSGGEANTASGFWSSVSGGWMNTASGEAASVSGGYKNTASGTLASILGGNTKTVSTSYGCHPSCA
jgi:hypothetical protein